MWHLHGHLDQASGSRLVHTQELQGAWQVTPLVGALRRGRGTGSDWVSAAQAEVPGGLQAPLALQPHGMRMLAAGCACSPHRVALKCLDRLVPQPLGHSKAMEGIQGCAA